MTSFDATIDEAPAGVVVFWAVDTGIDVDFDSGTVCFEGAAVPSGSLYLVTIAAYPFTVEGEFSCFFSVSELVFYIISA